jgi:hypothetical protein
VVPKHAWSITAALLLALLAACSGPESIGRSTPRAEPGVAVTPGPDDYVVTPTGWWYHRSCVREIEDGARINRQHKVTRRDGTTYQIPKCGYPVYRRRPGGELPPPVDNGWIESARFDELPGNWFSQLNASWHVPAAPASAYGSGQVYYSFPGVVSDSFILQPVMQYGTSGAGGGNFWAMASWQCDGPGGYCVHSSLVSIAAGDAMSGTVAASACSNGDCTWTVTALDVTSGLRSVLTAVDTANYFDGVGGAVEVYGLTTCDQFPGTGVFYTGISLYDQFATKVTPSWGGFVQSGTNPACNFGVASTDSTVTLYHNRAPLASVTGPTDITQAGTYTWTGHASGGIGTYSYTWQYRDAFNPNWVGAGSGQTISKFVDASTAQWFSYQVIVTSGDQTGHGGILVQNELGQCNPNC